MSSARSDTFWATAKHELTAALHIPGRSVAKANLSECSTSVRPSVRVRLSVRGGRRTQKMRHEKGEEMARAAREREREGG